MDTLRSKLKLATSQAHTDIESNPVLARLTSSDLTREQYTGILLRYFGFFDPLEDRLQETHVKQIVPDFSSRLRANRIASDLLSLGLSDVELREAPRCENLPDVSSLSRAMGVLYVIEGSRLGGMLIAKHLKQLDFYNEDAASFFTEDPQAVSARWKSFIEILETRTDFDESQVVAAAKETFEKLDRWMAGV